jgi:low temperature requirement protein LtrA
MSDGNRAMVPQVSRPVSWLELFYDLVFVSAVVTFSDAVSFDSDLPNVAVVAAAFTALWLIWLATTLHANRYRDDDGLHRGLVLVQMLLLTINALAVGDGFDAHPALISVTYSLLAVDVAIMYARRVQGTEAAVRLARLRRNQYFAAAVPVVLGGLFDPPARIVLWVIGLVLLACPTLGFRVGRVGGSAPLDEHHFVERLGLLTIIVCGESFVKVSLLAADGSLDGIDLTVLVTMFVFMFATWWSYFDDVPEAGLRLDAPRAAGWLLGHLGLQLSLVGVAVGYAKLLSYELGATLFGDRSLLVTMPLVGILVSLALIGVCSRRVPQRALLTLRVGVAAFVVAIAIITWRVSWLSAESAAVTLTVVAIAYAAAAGRLVRTTTVIPTTALLTPPP